MTENQPPQSQNVYQNRAQDRTELQAPLAPTPSRRPGLIRRVGCAILLAFWFALVMLPCALITLATQGQLVLRTGELSEQEARVWLIMEAQTRGLGVSNGVMVIQTDTRLCIETTANYLLWAGREQANVYCNCYARTSTDRPWSSDSVSMEACPDQ